jgi:elongator complex protein 3
MSDNNLILKKFVKQAMRASLTTKEELENFKRKFCSQNKISLFSNPKILNTYRRLVEAKEIGVNSKIERLLKLKKTRTISGVTPLAVFTKPFPCPGECVYCPIQTGIPKSYLDDEPAVMRAIMAHFSSKKQVKDRLKALHQIGHPTDKIELIVMGGTFSAIPYSKRKKFILDCLEACNQEKSNSLAMAQKKNEKAPHRLVGITFETRPDFVNRIEVKRLRELGGTRIEIGVQSIWDDVLESVKRGHKTEATIRATQLLKDAGFKVCYHLMPNLPGSTPEKDLAMFKEVFNNPHFCPDMLKIYPCVVTYQAPLYHWYKKGKFTPYKDEELMELLIKIKQLLPEWVRVNRLGRDIPVANIAAGTKISNIRQVIQRIMEKKGLKCQCIRCREVRGKEKLSIENCQLKIAQYHASGGTEYFLQYVDQENNLYALLRLRIPSEKVIFPVLKDSAIIRELHTYGPALPIAKKAKIEAQHRGLGKKLIKKAEEISRRKGRTKVCVISGVGARDYYQRLGYRLQETYMVKSLSHG